ncbi:Manganese/iron superoxide dismutase [Thermodesulfobacterium geofontis OPF15]|jgi:Fe-Mn family superoxide dismutase|uniref:superoxide dismutase n=1 Tax=Thermodesulfobacterium geofontis (strain OPF15) TaxID=795359 RepID=F8C524_THEGP|nr:Fe-Mn family superoxide dismutase [Thermodesulfobacterium geofontis]AEH23599.1 Manganese/iron superoxide dismutase [Thermodesulfobacterium geofontis OPF15]
MYEAKDYSKLVGMKGFSEILLKNHFTLYNGYVTNCNKLLEALMKMFEEDEVGTPEFAELKRRLGWEWNGMRLHELYFENLGGNGIFPQEGILSKLINEQFGSFENWKKEFIGIGLMRGIGWVILYQDIYTGKLINFWINEHDIGHPAGGNPLLVMDVFEHAYIIDYGLKKKDYIKTFFDNINWNEVEKRIIK